MNQSIMAAQAVDPGAHGWTASSRPDVDRMFRAAARHSRRVRMVRIALPIAVVAGLAVLWVATRLKQFPIPLPSVGSVVISGSRITMEVPRLAGYTRDSRPYEFTARTAAQDLLQPDKLELKDIRAKMEMQDKAVVTMSAANGTYSKRAEQLILHDRIVLTSTSGYEGHLSEAVIDMRGGGVVSEQPVDMKLINGRLKANRLEIIESGELMRFDGGVVMTMNPASGTAGGSGGASAAK